MFPKSIDTFVDLFGGGFNVGINTNAKQVWYNDKQNQIVEMLEYFNMKSIDNMLQQINFWINKYNLNKENKDEYINFRQEYNKNKHPLALYTLICFSFSNQIRFNSTGNFNMPFGKRNFNPVMRENFCLFINKLHESNVKFTNQDFIEFDYSNLSKNDFVYCDPPYFNSIATYNENGGWKQDNETNLLNLLDSLNDRNIRFALSNNLTTNPDLLKWATTNGYSVHSLNFSYYNCNYQKKNKNVKDEEVLITNYKTS